MTDIEQLHDHLQAACLAMKTTDSEGVTTHVSAAHGIARRLLWLEREAVVMKAARTQVIFDAATNSKAQPQPARTTIEVERAFLYELRNRIREAGRVLAEIEGNGGYRPSFRALASQAHGGLSSCRAKLDQVLAAAAPSNEAEAV